MSGGMREPMKIVIINTRYVETDATSFKSVVQQLTGKDSVDGGLVESSSSEKPRPPVRTSGDKVSSYNYNKNSVMSRGLSFKDMDKVLMDLPTLDELLRMLAD